MRPPHSIQTSRPLNGCALGPVATVRYTVGMGFRVAPGSIGVKTEEKAKSRNGPAI